MADEYDIAVEGGKATFTRTEPKRSKAAERQQEKATKVQEKGVTDTAAPDAEAARASQKK